MGNVRKADLVFDVAVAGGIEREVADEAQQIGERGALVFGGGIRLLAALLSKIDPDVYASAISYGLLLLLITSFLLLLSDRLKGDTQPDEPVADDSDSDNSTMDEEDLPLM